MKIIGLDTETTGFGASDRIVQLGAIVVDVQYRTVSELNLICDPQRDIPEQAAAIHGITEEKVARFSVPTRYALAMLKHMMRGVDIVVAHNADFDIRMLRQEFSLYDEPAPFDVPTIHCTMKAATPICKIPSTRGYKWPKLQQLHTHLFGSEFDGAHDAMEDIRATLRCYRELNRLHPDLF